MSYRTVTRDLGCKDCSASGKAYTYSYEGDGYVCQNGTMRNSEAGYEYGKNFWGQETRNKIEVGQESEPCPFCFGTRKKQYMAKKQSCSKCGGWGELTESRWEKGFFGGEVKKEYRSTCPECRGGKFSWVIAHELRNSQIEKSNL